MEKNSTSTQNIPKLSVLFSDSWEMFKGSLLNLLILTVIGIAVFVGIFIIGLLLALPLGAISIFSAIQSQQFTPAFMSSLGGLGLIFVIFMIAMFIVSIAFQAATLLIVSNYKEKPHVGHMIKKGFSFVLPLFLASIITGFIISGGYFLFIVPGILFQIFFYFVAYEIVLNNKGVLQALRRSIGIVTSNFWSILGRVLLLFIIIFGASFVPNMLVQATGSDSLQIIWSFASSIVSVLISWWSISYGVTLYRQAEKAAPASKTGKLLWPTLTAVLGWILGIIMIVSIFWFVFSVILPGIQNAALERQMKGNMMWEGNTETFDPEMLLDLLPTDSPERAELMKELEQLEETNGNMMMDDGTQMTDEEHMMYQSPTN